MPTLVTPTIFKRLFTSAYMNLDRDAFVRTVLECEPRMGDAWQDEKFDIFQAAGRGLARLPVEMVEAVINYALQREE